MDNLPTFFSVAEFAQMAGCSPTHIRHGAKNFIDGPGESRSRLPDGWCAIRWEGIYVIFAEEDADVMYRLFNAERPNHGR